MFKIYLWTFFISMVPLIELRGAIPVGFGLMQKLLEVDVLPPVYMVTIYLVAIVGNMLPVAFIYLFARKFLEWGQNKKVIGGICNFFLTKGAKAGEKLQGKAGRGIGIFFALMLFVGIPLPGTGAWTGTLAASLLDLKFKNTVFAVMLGVLLAGVIMLAASLGFFSVIFGLF